MWSDLRYAVRTLIRSPLSTITTVTTLALAIGANVTVGSAVDRVLFRPLDLPDIGRMVVVANDAPGIGLRNFGLAVEEANRILARKDLFSLAGSSRGTTATLTGIGAPQQLNGAMVMGAYFDVLGVQPALGRLLRTEDTEPGRPPVVVLSEALWRELALADPSIIGRSIVLDGVPHQVVGVVRRGAGLPQQAQYWEPHVLDEHARRDGADIELVVARPRTGLSMAQIAEALRVEAVRWHELRADEYNPALRHTLTATGFVETAGQTLRPIVLLIFATVSFMLLIACVNVAGVQLVRATVKANEVSIRSALGATRWRLLRHSIVESVLLAVCGGAGGLALGGLGIGLLQSWHPAVYPTLPDVRLDGRTVAYALGLTALVGCVVAIISGMPMRHMAGRGASMSHDRQRALRGIAIAQVALTLVLLLGSGLMIRSLGLVLRVNPGFDAASVYAGRVTLSERRYASREAVIAFYERLTARLRAMPSVTAAGAVLGVPFAEMDGASGPFYIVGRPQSTRGTPQHSLIQSVTPGYFAAMGISLRAGRNFTDADSRHGPVVAIIDDDVARVFFPGIDPIGQRMTGQIDTATIVGVVSSVGYHQLGQAHKATIYYPLTQNTAWSMQVVVRTSTNLQHPAAFLQSAVSELDRDVPVTHVASMWQRIDASVESRRATMTAMSAFAVASLALAILGLYGVISYGTAVRTHEFGIRMALGANARELLALVMRGGVGLVAIGLAIGLVLFFAVSRVLSSFLYGVGPHDPLTLVGCAVMLSVCAMLACLLPARRAASTDPMVALRDQF